MTGQDKSKSQNLQYVVTLYARNAQLTFLGNVKCFFLFGEKAENCVNNVRVL